MFGEYICSVRDRKVRGSSILVEASLFLAIKLNSDLIIRVILYVTSISRTKLTLLWYHRVNMTPGLFNRLNIPNFQIISFHLALYFLFRFLLTVSIHLILISMLPFL